MSMRLRVTYSAGAGNTFTLVRAGRRRLPAAVWQRLVPQLCQWTDGLLVLEPANPDGTVPVLFFNPDGSTGMFCGNGARCAAAHLMGEQPRPVTLLLAGVVVKATPGELGIRLRLPPPKEPPSERELELPTGRLRLWFVDVGAPHVLVPLHELRALGVQERLEHLPVEQLGRRLRLHPAFAPGGVNVSFYTVAQNGQIQIRTYERGVERETRSCGTAALAVALMAWITQAIQPPVTVIPLSRSPLSVDWEGESAEQLQALYLEGGIEVLGTDTVEVTLEEEA